MPFSKENKDTGLSANFLKTIALLAMTIDHLAWVFVPQFSILGTFMHLVGRITAPIMCFFLVEGFVYTHNRWHYVIRLGLFALIAQIPFSLFLSGKVEYIRLNMIYTLFICFIALCAWESFSSYLLRFASFFF